MALLHLLGLLIPNLELRVPVVDDVAANPYDAHLCPFSNPVDKLSEETSRGMLEIPQVDFYQQIHVPGVYHLRERMIEPGMLLHLPSLFV